MIGFSNFYLKAKIVNTEGDWDPFKVPLDDAVYTICPGCGKEQEFSLHELHQDPDFDLTGTAFYCPDCTAAGKHRAV